MWKSFFFSVVLFFLIGCDDDFVDEANAPSGPVQELVSPGELTGGALRAVWIKETGDGTDWHAAGEDLLLMGFDSEDGKGVRVLHQGHSNYNKPLLSPDGETVVFTDLSDGVGKLMRMDWGGGELTGLGPGLALDVWKDPAGQVWVYAGDGPMDYRGNVKRVFRFPLENPEAREIVWDHKVARDNFQLGRSGRYAGGLFPAAPAGGVVDLETLEFNIYAPGCWGSLSPGPRGLLWIFDGRHRNLLFFASDTEWLPDGSEDRWIVGITDAPGIDGQRVYYPRWSNHSRFFGVSGPMPHGAYQRAEIYVGRFSKDYRSVEGWTRLTDDDRPDLFPDVIVRPEGGGGVPVDVRGAVDVSDGAAADAFQVEGTLVEKTATPRPDDILPYRSALATYRYEVEETPEGGPGTILVAHWVIREGKVLRGFRREPGNTYSLELVPYDGNPDYQGERVVSTLAEGEDVLFVDVSSES